MDPQAAKQTCVVLGMAGFLFIIAGALHFIKMDYALFWGGSFFIIAGWVTNRGKKGAQN